MNNTKKKSMESADVIDFAEYVKKIDQEKADKFYEESSAKAEDLLKNKDKMERFLQKLEKKLKTIPVAGGALASVPLMISLIRNYIKKEYTESPVTSIISIIVALIYFLSPIDLIPDKIPGAGYIDDALILSACIALVRTDLEDYIDWRKEQGYECDDLPDYKDITKDAEEVNKFAKAFFKRRK